MSAQRKYDSTGTILTSTTKWFPSRRLINTLGFASCGLLLAYAYYLEYYLSLPPCPLCTLQRLMMVALGLVFLTAAVHDPQHWGARVYGILIALFAGIGAGIAGRHVWLQYQPAGEGATCLPGLDYLLDTFPITETLRLVLLESEDCSGIDWTFLGLSIPAWTLLAFIGLGAIGAVRNWIRVD